MNVRPLYFADEIFYWARTGRQSTVLEIQCGLAAKIDPLKMGDALLRALGVHTNLHWSMMSRTPRSMKKMAAYAIWAQLRPKG